ncbi:hypothetical protein BHE74_00003220 [Ensete ventricosum]|nr:hypothetical protein BHE74_00003220 [Ensete ventricosum]
MQEIQLDKNVKLLDCPGVVMLKSGEDDASIALRNCKRIEKLDDPVSPASLQDGTKLNAVTTDEDQPMAAYDGKDTVEMKTNSGSSQNDKLYAAEGILDPRKRRAEKKKRKAYKLNKTNEMDADYDFTVDYHMKDLPPDTADEDESNGEDDKTNKEVPMSGVEFDT